MSVIIVLCLMFLPCVISYKICEEKHRNPAKGLVISLLVCWAVPANWLVPLGLWLALKTRDPVTKQLI